MSHPKAETPRHLGKFDPTWPRLTATKNDVFHIYSDESSQHGGSLFTAIGAVFTRNDCAREMAQQLNEIAASSVRFPLKEFHWTKMEKVHAKQYHDLVSLFATQIRRKRLRYWCTLIENAKRNNRDYNNGDAELGLTKLSFGSIYALASMRGPFNTYVVYPDKRTTSHAPEDMVHALNHRIQNDFRVDAEPFLKVAPTPSHESRLIQVADVITGIIAYEKNGNHRVAKPSPHKLALWEHAKRELGLDTFAEPTKGYVALRFTIRNFDFTKAKPPPPKKATKGGQTSLFM